MANKAVNDESFAFNNISVNDITDWKPPFVLNCDLSIASSGGVMTNFSDNAKSVYDAMAENRPAFINAFDSSQKQRWFLPVEDTVLQGTTDYTIYFQRLTPTGVWDYSLDYNTNTSEATFTKSFSPF